MDDQVFRSNSFATWACWYAACGMGLFCFGIAAEMLAMDSPWFAVILAAFGGWDLSFFIWTFGEIGNVSADLNGVTIDQGGRTHRFGWNQVQDFKQLPLGPIFGRSSSVKYYRLRLRDPEQVTYFVPGIPKPSQPMGLWEQQFESMQELITAKLEEARRAEGTS